MNALTKINAVVSNDVHNLRRLRHKVGSDLCSLLNLSIEIKKSGCMISTVILGKLPAGIKLIITRNMDEVDTWDLGKIM